MYVLDVTFSVNETNLIARQELQQKAKSSSVRRYIN